MQDWIKRKQKVIKRTCDTCEIQVCSNPHTLTFLCQYAQYIILFCIQEHGTRSLCEPPYVSNSNSNVLYSYSSWHNIVLNKLLLSSMQTPASASRIGNVEDVVVSMHVVVLYTAHDIIMRNTLQLEYFRSLANDSTLGILMYYYYSEQTFIVIHTDTIISRSVWGCGGHCGLYACCSILYSS